MMDKEDKQLYLGIVKKAGLILIASTLMVFAVTLDMMMALSVVFGGGLSLAGFAAIIYSTNAMSLEGNVKGKVMGAYLFRYLIYFMFMFTGTKIGLNIVSMLIGFLCVNLGIKVHTLLERKEED